MFMKQFAAKSQHSKVEAAQASIPKNVEECQSHVNTLDTMNKYLFPLNLKRWHDGASERVRSWMKRCKAMQVEATQFLLCKNRKISFSWFAQLARGNQVKQIFKRVKRNMEGFWSQCSGRLKKEVAGEAKTWVPKSCRVSASLCSPLFSAGACLLRIRGPAWSWRRWRRIVWVGSVAPSSGCCSNSSSASRNSRFCALRGSTLSLSLHFWLNLAPGF